MRAAFYEIMRKRRAKHIGSLPLATFGASLSTRSLPLATFGATLSIECAAVSLPSAPSIAKLARGIQNLHEASLEVRSRESNRIQNAIEALRQKLKKFRLQWRREFWLSLKYFLLAIVMYIYLHVLSFVDACFLLDYTGLVWTYIYNLLMVTKNKCWFH